MRRAVILVLLYAGLQLVFPLGARRPETLALPIFGFLILAAYTVGELAGSARLPKLVGYLAAGFVFGPAVLGTVPVDVVDFLEPVSELAVALIAFLAGAELQWKELRDRGVVILKLLGAELGLTFLALTLTLMAMHSFVPSLANAPMREVVVFAVLFGSVAIVHSPAVTMAMLSETGARGPVARTTLGVVLVADVAVVVLFSLTLAMTRILVPAPTSGAEAVALLTIVWEVVGAVLVGAVLGGLIAMYLRFFEHQLFIFALIVAYFAAEIAGLLHVERLLMLLVAGFVAEAAAGGKGEKLRHSMERAAAPVFVVFFALAGAAIQPDAVVDMWLLVIPLCLVRAASIWGGTRIGATWAGTAEPERRYVWMGLLSQAGVAIGLAAIVSSVYPQRGEDLQTLFLAMIAINQVVGPILFRRALQKSGELSDTPLGHTHDHEAFTPSAGSPRSTSPA
ncbi:MAG TPA: cation:proton antiporter [Gemmatimonadaceae bacterium]|nr:cation:proton antiporter [Gemmatimonadaceae bacterium]